MLGRLKVVPAIAKAELADPRMVVELVALAREAAALGRKIDAWLDAHPEIVAALTSEGKTN